MPMTQAILSHKKIQLHHISHSSTTRPIGTIARLSCCLHNGAPATAEAMAPAPGPIAPPPHCLCLREEWRIKYNARMSRLQSKRRSTEEGICQNFINTYTDSVSRCQCSERGELSGGSLSRGVRVSRAAKRAQGLRRGQPSGNNTLHQRRRTQGSRREEKW